MKRHSTLNILLACILLFSAACKSDKNKSDIPDNPLFELRGKECGIDFMNSIENTRDFNIFSYRNFYNGGGAAIGDLNNDGLPEVYFTSNMGKNKLFLNKGNFQFEDISEKSGTQGTRGWSTGVTFADVNADGFLDIYVCNAGYVNGDDRENELFINNGDMTFTEQAADFGLAFDGYSTHAAFFDYDNDGDLDVYLLNNSFIPVNTLKNSNRRDLPAEQWPVRDFLKGGGDKLLRNDGPPTKDGKGGFHDVTAEAGIYSSLIGFGLGVTVGDVNDDGWLDINVANDFYEKDYLYINQKNGTFREEIEQWMGHLSLASMGSDMADINNDGLPEIFSTEMLPESEERRKNITLYDPVNIFFIKEKDFYYQYMHNTLQLNRGNNQFSDIAWFSGVAATDWSWGALMFDADNDGYRDIYVCNGIIHDLTNQDFLDFFADEIIQKMALTGKKEEISEIIKQMPSSPQPNYFFKNGGDLRFSNQSVAWGTGTPSFSNGAAYGDLDGDGDLDLVVNNLNAPAFVYQNKSRQIQPENTYLKVRLEGDSLNRFAIGAKIRVYSGTEILNFQIMPSRGFQSSVDYAQVFGLGKRMVIDSVQVVWPNGKISHRTGLSPNSELVFRYKDLSSDFYKKNTTQPATKAWFQVQSNSEFPIHVEDEFLDFQQEPLVMERLSREGPTAAVGDVNGDKLDDIVVGGGQGQATTVYLQSNSGAFVAVSNPVFEREAAFEDTASLLFDADGDGDLDLFVGSGGNHTDVGARMLQDRVYLNDGKGRFSGNTRALPSNGFNTSVAIAHDVDSDGDLDLFVGSRSLPQNYGLPPVSFLYINNGRGEFSFADPRQAKYLRSLGMVTDATFEDVTGDGIKDLIVTGSWMAPRIFGISVKGELTELGTNLANYPGWWSALKATDLDGDGDLDLILGNRGLNFGLQGDSSHPCKLWIGDFGQPNTMNKIITQCLEGPDKPVHPKKDLTATLPFLKKQNLKHADYARRSMPELFSKETLEKVYVAQASEFGTCIAINEGGGKFTLKRLPTEAQFSSVRSIVVRDVNGDKYPDLILAGNNHGFTPQFSALDASLGLVLLNDGKANFAAISPSVSGFSIRGDVPEMHLVRVKNKTKLICLVNQGKPVWFGLPE